MKNMTFRHVCFDFADGMASIAIRTTDSVEKVTKEVMNPKNWKGGVVPAIVRVYEDRW